MPPACAGAATTSKATMGTTSDGQRRRRPVSENTTSLLRWGTGSASAPGAPGFSPTGRTALEQPAQRVARVARDVEQRARHDAQHQGGRAGDDGEEVDLPAGRAGAAEGRVAFEDAGLDVHVGSAAGHDRHGRATWA